MAENNKKDSFNFPPVGGKNNKGPKFGGYWSFIIIAAFIIGIQFFSMPSNPERISWQKFKTELLAKGEVKDIYIVRNGGKAEITLKPEKVETHSDLVAKGFNQKSIGPQYYVPFGTLEQFEKNLQEAQKEYPEEAADVFIDYKDDFNWWGEVITLFLPIAIFVGIWIFFMRRMSKGAGGGGGGGIFNVGKSKAKLFDKESNIKITFKDVAGLAEAKQEVEEIVSFLKSPDKYTKLGGKIPKGALLVGPPGTGKTLMAKAMAGEANVPFFSMSGSDFVEMFVGVGASRVRDLFKQAKEKAPCIIFIDEIDAIGRARGKNPNMGANDERENTLNQLLTEMDGFETNSGVIILAATNRADILDSALLRAGRFDRQIYVDLPELKDREEIFKVHLKPLKLAEDID